MARQGTGTTETRLAASIEATTPVERVEDKLAGLREMEAPGVESLDRSSRMARQSFERARLHLLQGKVARLDDMQRRRIMEIDPMKSLAVLDDATMQELGIPEDVIGYYESGVCHIREAPDDELRRCAVHEGMHSFAYKEESELRSVSGLRVVEYTIDHSGNRIPIIVRNEGINEVLTERFTYQELKRQGDSDALWPTNLYLKGAVCGHCLEQLVGSSLLKEAFFNGRSSILENEFDKIADGRGAWKRFSEDVDKVVYSANPLEVSLALQRMGSLHTTRTLPPPPP